MDNSVRNFGGLFYDDIYGKDATLLRHTLYEMAAHLGHSLENPISLSLICLEFMIPQETCNLIYIDILNLIEGKDTPELKNLEQIKEIMIKHFPDTDKLSKLGITAFIKAMAKSRLPELQPYLYKLINE